MRKSRSSSASNRAGAPPVNPDPETRHTSFPIVGIGASAGGLEALTKLVENLSPDLGMAYVIVQHLDPKHKSLLVEILSRHTALPITEVKSKTQVAQNHIYVIPPNRNLYVERGYLCLSVRSSSPAREMPIDYLFRTVSSDCPGSCIGIVLSGTGSDGSLGIEEIKAAGGITFAQDQETAKHDGMPRAAIGTGCVDFILSPEAIARELARIARHPYTNGKHLSEITQEAQLQRVFSLLKNRTSVDFRHYKQSTIKRRIVRRMALLKIEGLKDYVNLVAERQTELDALYHDMLIKVTCFFREPNSFKALRDFVFPTLLRNRSPQEPIRLWIPGCSTGEEVYSLAIALLEYMGDDANSARIQLFGTDVSPIALDKARSGVYIENIALDVSPERLRRWFVRVDRGYQISKDVREMCLFAKQNLTSDPPFSRIDLISCRNLLIYLDNVLQARVMPIFHYALKPNGFLMLGNSESIGSNANLFHPVDKRIKIYTKKVDGQRPAITFGKTPDEPFAPSLPAPSETRPAPDLQTEVDRFILSRFSPVGVIVDEESKIIQFRGATGDYLEPSPGKATFHLLKMARGNLALELRSLIQRAKSTSRPVRKEGFHFRPANGTVRMLTLEVAPIQLEASAAQHFLVLFEASESVVAELPAPPEEPDGDSRAMAEMHKELTAAKTHLQSTIEEAEGTTEELKSANEEIMSSNEELQSTNEELETAKEELQSANEELTTVNEEVQSRNAELSVLNNDLTNFFGSVNIPVIMLGSDLRIRRFTPTAQRVFHLIPTDIGRPFGDIKPKIDVLHLTALIAKVIDTITAHEQEVKDSEGHYHLLSIRPYRTPENKIDGAILIFSDIDSVKRTSLELQESKAYTDAIVEAVIDPLLVLDSQFVIQRANAAYHLLFQTDARHTENRSLFALDRSQWDLPEIRELLQAAFQRKRKIVPVEVTERFSRIGERSFLAHARHLIREGGKPPLILLTLSDITVEKRIEKEKSGLAAQLKREKPVLDAIMGQMGMGVAIFEAPSGKLVVANDGLHSVLKKKLPKSATISSFKKIKAANLTDGTLRDPLWPMERSLRQGKVIPYAEVVLEHSKAERTVLHVSSSPVFDERKRMTAVVAVFLDITEGKRVKEQLVDISSREQRRIAHDLHDGVGQEVAAIGYRIKALKSRLAREHNKEAAEAEKIGALAGAALAHTRDLVKFLQPVAMDAGGLMQSLRDLATSSSRLHKIQCTFVCPLPISIDHPDVALHVFRIAQEAVRNATNHGKPRHIIVGLHKRGKSVELSIANDGLDFQPPRRARKVGLGLHLMQYRANLIHGKLSIVRQRPKGTVVKCLFKPNLSL